MFDHEQAGQMHYDEIPFVRPYEDTEDEFEENTVELPLAELEAQEEVVGKSIDPTDVPEPLALLAKRAEVKEVVQQVVQQTAKEIPNMPRTAPFDTPEPMGVLAMMAGAALVRKKEEVEAVENTLILEDAWFEEEPKIVLEPPKKKGWFSSFKETVSKGLDRAVEKFGNFLDTAVPTLSAAAVAVTLGSMGSQLSDFNKVVQASDSVVASTPVQVAATAKVEMPSIKASTVEAKKTSQADKNQTLIEKHAEIVQNAGGEKAHYLHSEASHRHFVAQLQKWGGYRAILEHPKVKEAKTTAQMINLVDEYFGEKVADLVEANAAAMHLPTALSL